MSIVPVPRRRRARLAALLLTPALAIACAKPPPGSVPSHVASAPAASAHERYSVYDLGATWRDQSGARRTLSSLAGRPQVVAMIYTSCTTSCPLTVAAMRRIAAAVPGAGLVLVTLDPARDGPARLAAYAREHALDAARWTLLTASDDDVRDLAAALGVRYRRVSAAELAHSNTLTVLDATGAVVDQQAGFGAADETIRAARASLVGARPSERGSR